MTTRARTSDRTSNRRARGCTRDCDAGRVGLRPGRATAAHAPGSVQPRAAGVYAAASLLLLLATRAHADGPLRLADVVRMAREQSPQLEAARQRAKAAATLPAQVSTWDDPVVSHEAWNFPDNFDIGRADNNIVKLSQKIPFPGKRTTAGEVAARSADVAARDADTVERDVVASAERAYADLWRAHEELAVMRRQRELAERVAHLSEQRYATSQATQADVLRTQVEVTHMTNLEQTGVLAIDAARAELNRILGREPGEPLGAPERPGMPHLPETPAPLIARALAERPEVAGQTAAIAREERSLKLAKLAYLPDFQVSASRFLNYGQHDGFGAMLEVSVPIVHKTRYDAGVGEVEARLAAERAEQKRLEDRIRSEVTQAFLRLRTAHLQHQLLESTHVPQAEQALNVTETAYRSGALDVLALLDSLRALEAVHLEHVQAGADMAKAAADLERAVGGEL